MTDYFICPHCGARVDVDAVVCPECGSDDDTGWAEGAEYADLFLNDDQPRSSATSSSPWVKIVIIIVLAVTLIAFLTAIIQNGFYLALFLLAATAAIIYFVKKYNESSYREQRKTYDALLIRARGDEALVERWIAYERHLTPDSDMEDLMNAALYRWERDNR